MYKLIEVVKLNDEKTLEKYLKQLEKNNQLNIINNGFDKDQNTLLHLACQKDHYQCLDLLLDYGADVNIKNITGATPLHVAANLGHSHCAYLLLNKHADINALFLNFNACYIAYQANHTPLLNILLQPNTEVDHLIDLAICKNDCETIFLALFKTENVTLNEAQIKKLVSLREPLWTTITTVCNSEENSYLKLKIYDMILDKKHPLGIIFNKEPAFSAFWTNKYTEAAKKYILESSKSTSKNHAFAEEDTPLLQYQTVNYNSFKSRTYN